MYHHISHLPTDFLPSSTISRFSPFFFTIFGGEFIISHQKGKGIFFSFFVYDSISSHGAPLCIGWNWVISLGELYLVVVVVLLQPFGQFFGKLPPFYLLPSSYILYILCSLRILPPKHSVWKLLKISNLNLCIFHQFLYYQKWPFW